MNFSPARILAKWIADEGFGVQGSPTTDWTIFAGGLADSPNKAISVTDTAGLPERRLRISGDGTDPAIPKQVIHHGVQVRTRSTDYNDGWVKSNAIQEGTSRIGNTVVSITTGAGTFTFKIQGAKLSSPTMYIGPLEKNKRQEFTFNLLLTITEL